MRQCLLSLLLLVLGSGASLARVDPAGRACQTTGDGWRHCWSTRWVLVGLDESLIAPAPDGAFTRVTGRRALDRAVADEEIQRIDSVLRASSALRSLSPDRVQARKRAGLDRLYRFHLPSGSDARAVARRLTEVDGVAFAEPDYVDFFQGQFIPNDPLFGGQWGFDQSSDADVDGPEAWDVWTGGPVAIAVVDTGIDFDHPDLAEQTLQGVDIVNGGGLPSDADGHGTQVASVAAADSNNAAGIAGACWGCRILPIKVANSASDGVMISDLVDAVTWAADNGASVINYSGGGADHTEARLTALRYAYDAGVVFVGASGNNGPNIAFPARYRESLAVGATTDQDQRWTPSGNGRALDFVAPGEGIIVATNTGGYTTQLGTSLSAPLVAGLVGLIRSLYPSVGREEVRHLIRAGADDAVGLPEEDTPGWDPYHGWGRVNMHRSLLAASSVTSLRVEGKTSTRVFLEVPNPVADSYDFVRGDLSALAPAGQGIDIGSPVCLKNDSPDPDTAGGHEDTATPAPGECFFYLARFRFGTWDSSWGGSSGNLDRMVVQPTEADAFLDSDEPFALFGDSVAAAGDVNNDGFGDVIVGAPNRPAGGGGTGAAFVYLGGPAGLATTPAWTLLSTQADSDLGASVASAGDVNGDGFDDVIVGEPRYDGAAGANEGRALVYLGSASGVQTTLHRLLQDPMENARFGSSVSPAGDVNNDGHGDVIVGAPRYADGQENEGRAYLFLGTSSGLADVASWSFESDLEQARAGTSVASAGNVNGDLYHDVIVGAPRYSNGQTDEGRAWVFLGSPFGVTSTPHATLEIDLVDARFGESVSTAGDIDDDGFDDVVVGALRYSNGEWREGGAFLFAGSVAGLVTSPSWSFETDHPWARLGTVATAGDVNGDDRDDVLTGSRGHAATKQDEGGAWLFAGDSAGLPATATWFEHGRQVRADFGGVVATAGDVNDDGFDDVVISAPEMDVLEYNDGRVFVYYGSPTGLTATPIHACDLP
jgi:hypothetical protein